MNTADAAAAGPAAGPAPEERAGVRDWFDETYARLGLKYLRPLDAYPIFVQLLDMQPGAKLLDVACGPGLLLHAAHSRGLAPHGIDVSRTALGKLPELVPAARGAQADAERLPFADGSFDCVTCVGALERMFDTAAVLREIHRVAAPDARFCFMVRNASTLVWRLYREALGRRNVAGHQDARELADWTRLFESCGFRVRAVHADQWPRQRLAKLARGWRSRDPRKDEPVRRTLLPLRFANEFVVVLEKAPAPAGS